VICRQQYHFHVRLFTFSPLAHFARSILVSYCLSPVYKSPAPGFVKGKHPRPIFPSSFILRAFALAKLTDDEPSQPSCHSPFWSCAPLAVLARLRRPPHVSLPTTAPRLPTDICLTPRFRHPSMPRHRPPPYTTSPTTAIRLAIADRSTLSPTAPLLA